jgi:hypothetical protein
VKKAALALALSIAGCSSAKSAENPPSPPAEEERGPLPDTHRLRCGFSWQQEVSASYGPLENSFTAVVECSGEELTLVGLTPFGTRAFLLRQKGSRVHFEKFVDRELPFSPRQILVDLHRAFFIGYLADESIEENFFHEIRTDEIRNGKLVKRTLRREESPGKPIVIDYGSGYDGTTPPPKITLENGLYGYRLEVETTAAEKL